MSKETDREMLPEYDFSNAVRGKYADRFGAKKEEILRTAAALDMQTWLAHSLLSFQRFESQLVAYWSLALRRDPKTAGECVNLLVESFDKKALRDLTKDLNKHTSVDEQFYRELRELIHDRNWLVHKSFHSLSSSRFESIADRSSRLSDLVSTLLLERCRSEGMQESEVKERAAEAVAQWAADRSAA